jgi:hypothetical protein
VRPQTGPCVVGLLDTLRGESVGKAPDVPYSASEHGVRQEPYEGNGCPDPGPLTVVTRASEAVEAGRGAEA